MVLEGLEDYLGSMSCIREVPYAFDSVVDLSEHDRKYHPNGYHEGDSCRLRDALGKSDSVDVLESSPMANMPDVEALEFLRGTDEEIDASISTMEVEGEFQTMYDIISCTIMDNSTDEAREKTEANARKKGINPFEVIGLNRFPRGMLDGNNCWKCVAATIARLRGIKVAASGMDEGGPQMATFFKSQRAMRDNYEKMPVGKEAITEKLSEMVNGSKDKGLKAYPDGTCIAMWDSHCTLAVKMGQKFIRIDPFASSYLSVYRADSGRLVDSMSVTDSNYSLSEFVEAISYFDANPNTEKGMQWKKWKEEEKAGRASEEYLGMKTLVKQYLTTKKSMRREGKPTDDTNKVIMRALEDMKDNDSELNIINGSYIVRPDQPIIEEMFGLCKNSTF